MSTLATLRADVLGLLDRTDLSDRVPGWVRAARGEMNTRLKHPQMEAYAEVTLTDGQAAIPDDFLKVLNIEIEAGAPLEFVHRNAFDGLRADTTSPSEGSYYTLQGKALITYPSLGDSRLVMRVRRALSVPTLDADTDWLMQLYPMADLYGAAMHGFFHTFELEKASAARREFDRAIENINMGAIGEVNGNFPAILPAAATV